MSGFRAPPDVKWCMLDEFFVLRMFADALDGKVNFNEGFGKSH
ncbi:MAG: hypothetical protein AB1813_01595 [Verrucomicrobiota bacterium]